MCTACPRGHFAVLLVLQAGVCPESSDPCSVASRNPSRLMGRGPSLSLPTPVTLEDPSPVVSHPHSHTVTGKKNLVFYYKLIANGMLPISSNYMQWPISGNPTSQVMSIKLKYLCLAHKKHPDQAHMRMTAGRKK